MPYFAAMPFIHAVLASLLVSSSADIWNPDNSFIAMPIPVTSSYEYAAYLANCSKLFHSLVENCGDGKTDCPLLTDRTPPIPVSEAANIIQPGATTIQKLMAFFDYNVDQEILNATGYQYGTDVNNLHESDFDLATNNVWQCNRLNYRHLFHYEFATSGELGSQLIASNGSFGPLGDFLANPDKYYNIGESKVTESGVCTDGMLYLWLALTVQSRVPMSPTKVILVENVVSLRYSTTGYEEIPFSKYYLFKSFAKNMKLAYAAKTILTGNTLLDYLNASFTVTAADQTVPNTVKGQLKQFINLITTKWAANSDVNQRYHDLSESYYTLKKYVPWTENYIGRMTLGDYGQLGDFFYLNYFFGLPS